jgi:archaellum component FlaF (FlaF/FlaG flagellin family)
MRLNQRSIYVGLFALQIILAVYLLFTYLEGKSSITIEKSDTPQSQQIADSNEVGRLGTLGIGAVRKAKFVNLNENRQISREFGFEELLHKTDDQWEISKPFLNLYQQDFVCRITAESGVVLADELTNATDIKEATLSGNVVAHITSRNSADPQQYDIYLDDIVFISNRSLFLTTGPVKVLAKDMQLLGKGLEIVYNYAKDRLELFRIIELQSLCINRVSNRNLFGLSNNDSRSEPPGPQTQSVAASAQSNDDVDKYRAMFNKNVVIRSAGQVLKAADSLTLKNIIRNKTPGEQDLDTEPEKIDGPENTTAGNLLDVVVTCSEGLVVCPMDVPVSQVNLLTTLSGAIANVQPNSDWNTGGDDVNSLTVRAVEYDDSNGTAVAAGPVKLTYHSKDYAGNSDALIATITAKDKLSFNPASRRVIFEGDCVGTFIPAGSEQVHRYILEAPKITAVLSLESHDGGFADLRHIAAEGGAAAIVHDTALAEDTARFTAPRIDYFADGGNILSTGPSELKLLNRPFDSAGKIQPVRVTAEESVLYTPSLNKVVFKGDCFSETILANPEQSGKYTLQAQNISVQLQPRQKDTAYLAVEGIRKVTAKNDAVITIVSPSDQGKIAEFVANEIVYDSSIENISATGLSRLQYFSQDVDSQSKNLGDVPITITAHDSAQFSLASNQAFFRGQCVCTMIRTDTGTARKFHLTAPQVAVDIASSDGGLFGSAGISYLSAGDNAVIVVTPINSLTELARFTAARIKYNAGADSVVAEGPCDFIFYANDFMSANTRGAAVPVHIFAEKKTTFMTAKNQLTFEGDCICTTQRNSPDTHNKYTLAAPVITIDLSKQNQQDLDVSTLSIKRFTAQGSVVQISNVNTQSDSLVAFSKIKCIKFIYDTEEKLFTAVGPGVITLDNSKVQDSVEQRTGLSITKKCYAFLRNFETLKFDLNSNRIIARSEKNKILADYFPVVNGRNEQQISASAGAIEIELSPNPAGRDEISSLRAFEGITYEDSDNQFSAGQMFYDSKTSLIKATGSDFHRCYLNGAGVDNIIYDLDRRAVVNVDLTEPGMVKLLK